MAGDTVQLLCAATEVVGNPSSSVTLVRLDRVTTGTVTVDPANR